jgi:hypothetical protein
MDEARQAGVVKPNSGWVKFPSDMLVASVRETRALVCPDVMHGIYTPENCERTRDHRRDVALPKFGMPCAHSSRSVEGEVHRRGAAEHQPHCHRR